MQGRVDRLAPDQRDRPRRQALMAIGVIGRIQRQILPAQVAVKALPQGINHRRVGLQFHIFMQTAHKHPGNLPAFRGQRRSFSMIEAMIRA